MHLAVIGQVVDVDRKYSLPTAPELSRGQAHEDRNRGAGLLDVLVTMKTKHILRLMAMPTDFKQNGSDEASQ